jgi:hypothetical protein
MQFDQRSEHWSEYREPIADAGHQAEPIVASPSKCVDRCALRPVDLVQEWDCRRPNDLKQRDRVARERVLDGVDRPFVLVWTNAADVIGFPTASAVSDQAQAQHGAEHRRTGSGELAQFALDPTGGDEWSGLGVVQRDHALRQQTRRNDGLAGQYRGGINQAEQQRQLVGRDSPAFVDDSQQTLHEDRIVGHANIIADG